MKLSQSRDPRPLPDFAASFLQPHLFNFTSALSLRALLVSSLLYLYLHLLSISASMAGKQGSLSLLTTSTACTPYGVTLLTSVNPTECLFAPLFFPSEQSFNSITCEP